MADEVQPGLTPEELELSNALIAVAIEHNAPDVNVASAASALLAGAICGMLGFGSEDTPPEEYNEAAAYIHGRIEEFALALMAEITTGPAEVN